MKRPHRLLSRSVLLLFGGGLTLLLFLHILSLVQSSRLKTSSYWVNHTHEVIASNEQLLIWLGNAEQGAKNYILTARDSALELYFFSVKKVHEHLRELKNLTAQTPQQSTRFEILDESSEKLLRQLDDQIETRHFQGLAAALLLFRNGEYDKIASDLRKVSDQITDAEQENLKNRNNRSEELAQSSEIASLIATFFDFAFFIAAFWLLRMEISRRQTVEAQLSNSLSELGSANRSLQESNQVKTQFLAMAAHDLRAPLRQIHIFSQLLQRKGDIDSESLEMVKYITRGSKQMSELLEDLLQESALRSGGLKLKIVPTQLRSLLDLVVENHRFWMTQKKQILQIDGNEPRIVHVDEKRMMQIFENLLSNAIKYSPIGGMIIVRTSKGSNFFRVEIKDQGPGLEASELKELFTPFRKSNKTPTAGEPSTGLGLSIAKQLVEMHGGRLMASSDGLGRGSTFTIEIPLPGTEPKNLVSHVPAENLDNVSIFN